LLLAVLTNCVQSPQTGTTSNSSNPSSTPAATNAANPTSGKEQININTAILSELDKLEAKLGVPALSNKIQASRPYGNPQELVSKKVITQEQFDQIKNVDGAIQVLPEQQRQSPQFVLQVINGLLDSANSEYGAAIANGKIAAVIEYQDSRGFVNYADTLRNKISDPLAKQNPAAQKVIADSMTQLKTAWPSAQAPATPVLPTDKVSQLIKTIEQNAQNILKS
jgi:hypothetical protein